MPELSWAPNAPERINAHLCSDRQGIIEPQNISTWNGPVGITESNSLLLIAPPKLNHVTRSVIQMHPEL